MALFMEIFWIYWRGFWVGREGCFLVHNNKETIEFEKSVDLWEFVGCWRGGFRIFGWIFGFGMW